MAAVPMLHPRSARFASAAGLLALLIALTLAIRILSPSDIASRDQSRTVSYTIDIVSNGNWLLQADADGLLATKPPLVNYLSALLVAPFGANEWTFMFPSLAAYFATVWLTFMLAREAFGRLPERPGWLGLSAAEWAVLLAAAFYGLSFMSLRLAFVARPDMILVFFLTLSFWSANRALASQPPQGAGWAFAFWLGVCLSALAKGPIALVPVAYAVLAARLLFRDWKTLLRVRPLVGVPVTILVAAAWPLAVALLAPQFFRDVLLGQEIGGQFKGHWYSGLISAWQLPLWLISRFLPWSLLLPVAILLFPWRAWRRHPLAPHLLYVAVLAVPFVLASSRRGDRFAPFYPSVAVLCAWAAVYAARGQGLLFANLAAVPATIAGLAVYFHFFSEQAVDRSGQRMIDFVGQVKATAQGEPVVVCRIDNRSLPLQAFLGINQRGRIPHEAPAGGWVVAAGASREPATVALSESIPVMGGRRLHLRRAAIGETVCEERAGDRSSAETEWRSSLGDTCERTTRVGGTVAGRCDLHWPGGTFISRAPSSPAAPAFPANKETGGETPGRIWQT